MERDKINKLFDYYFGEVIKESCNEVWDAQYDIVDFCEFMMGKSNISNIIIHLSKMIDRLDNKIQNTNYDSTFNKEWDEDDLRCLKRTLEIFRESNT